MNFLMTCTTEELALFVSLCGFPGEGRGIAESSFGRKSGKEWDAIIETTIHQLMVKDLWDEEKAENDEVPFPEDLQKFIIQFTKSNWIVRCSDFPRESVLMIHHLEGEEWTAQIIHKDIVHEFYLLKTSEIPSFIQEYYSFPIFEGETKEFFLTEKGFNVLSDQNKLHKVRKMSNFTAEEEEAFNYFMEDLGQYNWSLFNIAFFHIPNLESDPYMQNIFFFLPSNKGMWLVEYSDDTEKSVRVRLEPFSEWKATIEGVQTVAEQVTS
ncbi:hypothetical protein [Bacillus massilinigeriensis]|uniref:hypothetical protein n=1 Tax=Bacillus mediterraneensis TaxID=1805474 RepID=UPI0008F916DE|nr:hypothetical protein [Bacillus mediterraneensis]